METKKMKITRSSSTMFSFLFIFVFSIHICSVSSTEHVRQDFLICLTKFYDQNQNQNQNHSNSSSNFLYTPRHTSYGSILESSLRNLRFGSSSTPKPDVIVTPANESQIQQVIYCARHHGMQIRTRSGGHDFEGISSVSEFPFVIIDLRNLRKVDVNVESHTAWVQAGASLGEVYYNIGAASKYLAFPAGVCPTVGIGGYIGGGGYGAMKRMYGLAADNVIDAILIDANGRILNRKSMGEDLFWAIRGGGASSFGVVFAWRLNLVPVPEKVTVCQTNRNLSQNATKLVHRWQSLAHTLPHEMYLRVQIQRLSEERDIVAEFVTLYLGSVGKVYSIMEERFPDLGMVRGECNEMSWVESTVFFGGFQGEPLEILLNRTSPGKAAFKAKSDYVEEPIPEEGLEGLWELIYQVDPGVPIIYMTPYGGRMGEIPEYALPFPHRAGNLYMIFQGVSWIGEDNGLAESRMRWIRNLSDYLGTWYSKNPRRSYLNYNDLDLGVNNGFSTNQVATFGSRYFNKNFARLMQVKTMVDPTNFFRHEQSIPLSSS